MCDKPEVERDNWYRHKQYDRSHRDVGECGYLYVPILIFFNMFVNVPIAS